MTFLVLIFLQMLLARLVCELDINLVSFFRVLVDYPA